MVSKSVSHLSPLITWGQNKVQFAARDCQRRCQEKDFYAQSLQVYLARGIGSGAFSQPSIGISVQVNNFMAALIVICNSFFV